MKEIEAALKEKMNQLARKYDYDLVFKLWTRITRAGCIKNDFCKGRWKPDMTIMEGMDCLEDYFVGLAGLLQKRHSAGDGKQPMTSKSVNPPRIA